MYAGRIFLGVDVINQKQSVEQKKAGQGWLAVAGSCCWTGTAVALCVEVGAVVDVAPEACKAGVLCVDPVIYYPFNKIRALISGSGVCVVCVVWM